MSRLGWAVVGCGWVARDYAGPAIRASANGELLAGCDPDPAAREAFAAALPGVPVFAGFDDALARPGVHAAYVATPNHTHAAVTEACAAAGKHVLCEKPMATSAADALRMVEACRRAGVTYATAFDQRFHPHHARLRGLIAGGRLGVVTQVRLHYACWLPADWAPRNWRVDPAQAGGGAGIDLAPHGVDLIASLTGADWVELRGLLQRRVHDYAVDDGAVLMGRLGGDILATLHVAYNCPETYPRRRLEVIGTRAMAAAENTMGQDPGGTLTLTDAGTGRVEEVRLPPAEAGRSPFLGQVEAFAAAVLAGEPFPHPPERDLRHLELLLDALGCAG